MNNELQTKTLVVIAGPTASGKTAVAIELAKKINTVILSADSRQFYREMSIGTAKPAKEELAAIRHYFINSLSITEAFNAGDFEQQALALLNDLFKAHDVVVLVGGSGLFIKAVCEGFDSLPPANIATRDKLNLELHKNGLASLQERLKVADPVYAGSADINNPQRVMRALEVFESTGKPISSYHTSAAVKRPFSILKFGLDLPREILYQQINKRVDDMVNHGLVEEVRSLLNYRHLNALNTVGYSELFDYFDGKTDLSKAIGSIKQNTRRFAKRQMTWFSKDKGIIWLKADSADLAQQIYAKIH